LLESELENRSEDSESSAEEFSDLELEKEIVNYLVLQ